jgi:7-cyano-7-deazaguanine synthase
MPSSILLFSAGLDSTVNLKMAADDGKVFCALTFDYGQRAAEREAEFTARACRRLAVRHEIIRLPWLKRITTSALVNRRAEVPKPKPARLDDPAAAARTAAKVWVPNRNGVFLAVAASFAEAAGVEQIVSGFNAEEAATFPDNSVAFLNATNRALRFSTMTGVRAVSYTAKLRKTEIVRLGMKIGAPLDLVWCCYFGGKRICGECESCRRFLRAVREADAEDWFLSHHRGFRRKGR